MLYKRDPEAAIMATPAWIAETRATDAAEEVPLSAQRKGGLPHRCNPTLKLSSGSLSVGP